ncbi:MAG: response regulator [Planctomycetia bacterium]|nr:response regulator [Planctomycetia bacterium]
MPIVLVVDDSEVDRRLVGGLLERHGRCGVVYANDGKEALLRFATAVPDLVLTDLQMPEMDGLELVAAIKGDYPLTPVVLMTAQGSEEIASEALRRGAASYVPKKKLAEDLVETVERVLAAASEDRTHSRLMHHLTECEEHFVVGNDLNLIRALIAYVQQHLRCMPLGDETERLRVGIALEEAMKNAYYHGSLEIGTGAGWPQRKAIDQIVRERLTEEPYRNRKIFFEARISRTEAKFTIRDQGPGFDASLLPDPAAPLNYEKASGRGIILMRTIMDEVRFNADGNEVTLIKRPPAPEEMPADDAME